MYSTTTNYLERIKIYGDRSHDGTVTRAQGSHCTKPTRLSTLPHNSLKGEEQPSSLTDGSTVHMPNTPYQFKYNLKHPISIKFKLYIFSELWLFYFLITEAKSELCQKLRSIKVIGYYALIKLLSYTFYLFCEMTSFVYNDLNSFISEVQCHKKNWSEKGKSM